MLRPKSKSKLFWTAVKFFRLCVLTIPSGKAAPDVDVNTFRRSVQILRSYAQHMGFMVFNVVKEAL